MTLGWSRDRIVILLVLTSYTIGLSYYTILRYLSVQTYGFDFGIFNQVFSSTLQGKLFYETPDQNQYFFSGNFLGVHFSPVLFLLVPLYAVYPHAESLLVIQTIFVALGSIPVYLIARDKLGSGKTPLILMVLYLANPMVQALNVADFHIEALFPLFFLSFYYCLLKQRWNWYWLMLALTYSVIEFAPVMVFFASASYLIANRRSFLPQIRSKPIFIPLVTCAISVAYFYGAVQASLLLSGNTAATVGSVLPGFFFSSVGTDYFTKLEFWLAAFASFVFVPLGSLPELIMLLPWLAVSLVGRPAFYSLGWQYGGAFVAPPLALAFINGLRKFDVRFLYIPFFVAFLLTPLNPLAQHSLTGLAYEEGFPVTNNHTRILQEAVSMIPPAASVYTQNSLFPLVSNRISAYLYLPQGLSPDYILADSRSWTYAQSIWGQQMSGILPRFLADDSYGLLVYDDGAILLQHGYRGGIVLQGASNYTYGPNNLFLVSGGRIHDNSAGEDLLVHFSSMSEATTFWYGPYASLSPGTYSVDFRLKSSVNNTGRITLDVDHFINTTYAKELGNRTVRAQDLAPGEWSKVSIRFSLTPQEASIGSLEFRGIDVYGGTWYLQSIEVVYVGG